MDTRITSQFNALKSSMQNINMQSHPEDINNSIDWKSLIQSWKEINSQMKSQHQGMQVINGACFHYVVILISMLSYLGYANLSPKH